MPSVQQSWFKPGLRFCGSCFVWLLYWAAWLALSATLVGLLYIAVARELSVPDFILRRVETRLAEANLTIKFGRARLDPSGQILLENVELRSRQFAEPLLVSRLVYFRRSVWSILAGRPIPDEIRLEGATLQLPAMLSPSGTAEPVMHDLAMTARNDGDNNAWHIDQLSSLIGRLKVTVQGNIGTAAHAAKKPSPEEIISRFLEIGRRVIVQVRRFDAFDEPALDIFLENQVGIGNTATCTFTADASHHPWNQPFTTGPFAIKTTLRIDGDGERTIRLQATIDRVIDSRSTVDALRAIVSVRADLKTFSFRPVETSIAAGGVTAEGERVLAPLFRATLSDWPEIKISAAAQLSGEFISAKIEADWSKQSARIAAEGRGSPEMINRELAKHTPRAALYFIFGDPVAFTAEAMLSSGWHFEKLSSRVSAGRLNSHDVKITSARGRIDIEGMNFLAYDAQVEMGENVARGSYWMNFLTTDYRMLLTGRLRPPQISGWFNGEWWTDFWNEHFDFPAALPQGDVDVQGRWRDAVRTEYFGGAQATSAGIWGGKFERVQSVVFLRPFFTHVIEFNGARAAEAQQLRGWLKRFGDPVTRQTQRLEFDLEGNVDPETYHGMLDGKADEVLATLQFSVPPHVHARGSIEDKGAAFIPNYTFTGHTEAGLRYYGFPLEKVQVTGVIKGEDVRLDDIQFDAFGGNGAGKATVSGPTEKRRLGFDLYLNGANLIRTIRAVQEYQITHSEQKAQSATDSAFIKRAAGGKLDVALSAQGTLGNFASFAGTGNAALTGANLGEIQLFGLLSQVLSGLSLNFSSLKLDSAHTSFRMENGRLHFPDLKITGPSAAIDARGDFTFETTALDFTAKFKPFEETRSLLTAAIGIVINPITSILELKLTGPLNKPNWSIDVGTSAPHHDAVIPKEKDTVPVSPLQ